ncbi:hypothetical protein ACGFY7_33050 [Streptomyces prunicolor]|uniref:hypothetical protein n=1 Tax=Streptomyces prunicolor TaxID=67348 RepID=UPI00371003F8
MRRLLALPLLMALCSDRRRAVPTARRTPEPATGPGRPAAFYDDARSWDPSSKAVSSFLPSELCRIVVQDQKPHTSRLSISYGASVFPLDSPFGEKSEVDGCAAGGLQDRHPHRRHRDRAPPAVPAELRRVMAKAFACRNNPAVPTKLPAA